MENNISGSVCDRNGRATVNIENTGGELKMLSNANYKLGNNPFAKPKKSIKKPSNVGVGSNGFAAIATLAAIIAIGGVIIAYLTLKY